MSAKNLAPIKSILDLVVDGVKDGIAVETSGKPIVQELSVFANLVGDVPAMLGELPSLPGSLSGFDEPDASALVAYVLAKGVISDAHAQAVINAALQAAQALWSVYLTVKGAVPAAAPAPAGS